MREAERQDQQDEDGRQGQGCQVWRGRQQRGEEEFRPRGGREGGRQEGGASREEEEVPARARDEPVAGEAAAEGRQPARRQQAPHGALAAPEGNGLGAEREQEGGELQPETQQAPGVADVRVVHHALHRCAERPTRLVGVQLGRKRV